MSLFKITQRQVFSGPVSGNQMRPKTTHISPHKLKKADRSRLWERVCLSAKNYATLPVQWFIPPRSLQMPRTKEKKKKKGTTSNPDLKEAHEIYVPTQLTRSYPNEVKITGYGGGGVQFPWQQAGSGSFSHKSAFTIEFFARLKREEEKTHLDALTRACAHWTSLYQKQNPGWESQQKLWRPRWGGKGGGQSLSSFFSSHRGSVFFTMKQKLAKSRSV